MKVMRNVRTSLECNCSNCQHSIKRSDFDLNAFGAWAYPFVCELTPQCCYQSTACCKCWKKKRGGNNEN